MPSSRSLTAASVRAGPVTTSSSPGDSGVSSRSCVRRTPKTSRDSWGGGVNAVSASMMRNRPCFFLLSVATVPGS